MQVPCGRCYILLAAAGWPLQGFVDMLCYIARHQQRQSNEQQRVAIDLHEQPLVPK